jgi:hypothetical protein
LRCSIEIGHRCAKQNGKPHKSTAETVFAAREIGKNKKASGA